MKDVIYRDDVVREFIKLFGCIQDISDIDEWADICQTTVCEVPSVDDEWVPVSKRLPEEHEWVGTKKFGTTISDKVHITFDVNGERFVRTLSLQNGELSNYEKRTMDTLHKGWKMIAWMPLPEPYKGGEDE